MFANPIFFFQNVCNLTNDGDVCFPTKSDLAKKGIRVYVTTLITAGRCVPVSMDVIACKLVYHC